MEIDELRSGFVIGDYTVYPNRTQLLSPHGVVHLEPKVMEVLVMLASRAGSVVTRRELLESLWPKAVVGDECLTRCISLLRKALCDSARLPKYIRTAPRTGYVLLPEPVAVHTEKRLAAVTAPDSSRASGVRQALRRIQNAAPVRVASAAFVSAWLTLKLLDLAITIVELPMSFVLQAGLIIVAILPSLTAITWLVRSTRSDGPGRTSLARLPTALALAVSLAWLVAGLAASQQVIDGAVQLANSVTKSVERKSISAGFQVEKREASIGACQKHSQDVLSAAADAAE